MRIASWRARVSKGCDDEAQKTAPLAGATVMKMGEHFCAVVFLGYGVVFSLLLLLVWRLASLIEAELSLIWLPSLVEPLLFIMQFLLELIITTPTQIP
ncbi:MAG: hypothetical protein HY777_00365 [Betaproteobacteria bacterium]|nr:hypothetical protein [Betaproteobacteria bacterium]